MSLPKPKVRFDPKTGLPKIELDESDIADAYHIKQMMETRGWQALMRYYAFARESMIDAIKDSTRTRAKIVTCPERASTLRGFDEFLAIPNRIVERVDEFIDEEKEKEVSNGRNGAGNTGAD